MVRVLILLPGITAKVVEVDFLVDTGAMATVIHPRDAIFRLGITPMRLASPEQWQNLQTMQGVGGTSTQYVVPAEYGFLQIESREVV